MLRASSPTTTQSWKRRLDCHRRTSAPGLEDMVLTVSVFFGTKRFEGSRSIGCCVGGLRTRIHTYIIIYIYMYQCIYIYT